MRTMLSHLCPALFAALLAASLLAPAGAWASEDGEEQEGGLFGAIAAAIADLFGSGEDEASAAGNGEQATNSQAAGTDDGAAALELLKHLVDQSLSESGDVSGRGITVAELRRAVEDLYADPYYSGFVSGFSWTYRDTGGSEDDCPVTGVTPTFTMDVEQLEEARAGIEAAIDEALTWTSDDMDDAQKAQALHDWLVRTTTLYRGEGDEPPATASGAVGALVEHCAAVRGYAAAYALLLEAGGVACEYAFDAETGTAVVLVQVDGAWYLALPGFDEVDGQDDFFHAGHTFFLVGTTTLAYAGVSYVGDTPVGELDYPQTSSWPVYASPVGEPVPEGVVVSVEYTVTQDEDGTVPDATSTLLALMQAAIAGNVAEIPDIRQYGITNEDFEAACDVANRDPYFNALTDGFTSLYYEREGASGLVYSVGVTYRGTISDLPSYHAALDAGIANALSGVTEDMDAYDKALYLHDWLVSNVAYDESKPTDEASELYVHDHTAYGALVDGLAVCDGYSRAYQLLLTRVGVACAFVASEGMTHSWNLVQLDDGLWYHVDVTWDDPTPDQGPGYENHTYFLLGEDAIAADHWDWVVE